MSIYKNLCKNFHSSDKNNHKIIDLYTLNPGSNIFSILKTAHFNSKIVSKLILKF